MSRKASVTFYDRKEPGYPSKTKILEFSQVEDLILKMDREIDELASDEPDRWRKVDVRADGDFSSEEKNLLLENLIEC